MDSDSGFVSVIETPEVDDKATKKRKLDEGSPSNIEKIKPRLSEIISYSSQEPSTLPDGSVVVAELSRNPSCYQLGCEVLETLGGRLKNNDQLTGVVYR